MKKINIIILSDVCHDTSTPMIDPKKQGDNTIGKGPRKLALKYFLQAYLACITFVDGFIPFLTSQHEFQKTIAIYCALSSNNFLRSTFLKAHLRGV
jgi:hypothetical protein